MCLPQYVEHGKKMPIKKAYFKKKTFDAVRKIWSQSYSLSLLCLFPLVIPLHFSRSLACTYLWTPPSEHPSCTCVCHQQAPVGHSSDGLSLRAWAWMGHGGWFRGSGVGYPKPSRPWKGIDQLCVVPQSTFQGLRAPQLQAEFQRRAKEGAV